MKRFKVICPLLCFQIPVMYSGKRLSDEESAKFLREREQELIEGIDLYNGIKVKRISKEDLEALQKRPLHFPRGIGFSRDTFVLEKFITDEDEHYHETDDIMWNGVLALRLLKKGYVWGSSTYLRNLDEKMFSSSSWNEELISEFPLHQYVLSFDDIPELRNVLARVQSAYFANRRDILLASRRFQRAYVESKAEDCLIDYMIAFESLYLRGKKAGASAGQIIAVACSSMLGRNHEEREEIRRFLSKAYSLRNYLVHGSECREPFVLDGREYMLDGFVSIIEDYLRESIKKSLD